MFEDSLLESGGRLRTKRGRTTTIAFIFEICLVALLVLIPNPVRGRLALLACGGMVLAVGGLLHWNSRRLEKAKAAKPTEVDMPSASLPK